MTNKLSAILLLSGYSKRFNYQNKLLMELNGRVVLDYVLAVVSECNFLEVIVVCRELSVIEKVSEYGFKIVENKNAFLGVSESIKLGVKNSSIIENSKEGRGYMFFQGEQMFITTKDIKTLVNTFENNSSKIIIPSVDNTMLSPVIFPKSFRDELLSLNGEEGGKKIIDKNKDKIKLVEIENKNFGFDIDTIDDFNKAIDML